MITTNITKISEKTNRLTVPDGRVFILLALSGTALIESAGIFTIDNRSCLILPPQNNAALTTTKNFSGYAVDVPVSLRSWHNELLKKNVYSKTAQLDIKIQKRYINETQSERIKYLLADDASPSDSQKTTLSLTLALYLLSLKRTSLNLTAALPDWLEDSIVNIDISHTVSDITAEAVMSCNYSKSNFLLLFKKYTGIPFSQYLIETKIKTAVELLQVTSLSILDISNMLSFSSLSYFIKNFKNYTGMPPGQYRKQHLQTSDKY